MKRIIFTGGGSLGHVTPNIALIKKFLEEGWDIDYVGSKAGLEKEIITKLPVTYFEIETGKLRRYFSWKNFGDAVRVCIGIVQAIVLIRKRKPNVIFSKGGFVSFPIVVAGWFWRVPVVIHESDMSPGLTTRLSAPFATKICLAFPEAGKSLKRKEKLLLTGLPVREEILKGNKEKAKSLLQFSQDLPILLVVGGSQGSVFLNKTIRDLLAKIELDEFNVIHVCGRGGLEPSLDFLNYRQYELLNQEYADMLVAADIVVTRGGATALFEIMAAKKPNIIIPLGTAASRGDQLLNAEYFHVQGVSTVLQESELTEVGFLEAIKHVYEHKNDITKKITELHIGDAAQKVFNILKSSE